MFILSFANAFNLDQSKNLSFGKELISSPLTFWQFRSWVENFTKILKNILMYSQSLLIFIHKTPVIESHQTTRKIRDLLWPRSTPTGNTVYFYMSSSLIYIQKINRRSFKHSVRCRKIIACGQ